MIALNFVWLLFIMLMLPLTFLHNYSGHAAGVQHSAVQHLALGLLAQLMQKSTISTQVTDRFVPNLIAVLKQERHLLMYDR